MALTEYDIVDRRIDKSKSWIDIKSRRIFTKEFKRRNTEYIIAKKYNTDTGLYSFYIIIGKDLPNSRILEIDDYGRMKIRISDIWEELNIRETKYPLIKCQLIHSEESEDYDSYRIEVLQ